MTRLECDGHGCELNVRTLPNSATDHGCIREVVGLSSAGSPGLTYPTPDCIVNISGWFLPVDLTTVHRACILQASQTLTVTFTSGANSAFSGTFGATGTFTPTAIQTSVQGSPVVKKARIAISGGSFMSSTTPTTTGFGTIDRTFFDVTFPRGLDADLCYPNALMADHRAGALKAVAAAEDDGSLDNGLLTVQF
jgi:hypothetical protein